MPSYESFSSDHDEDPATPQEVALLLRNGSLTMDGVMAMLPPVPEDQMMLDPASGMQVPAEIVGCDVEYSKDDLAGAPGLAAYDGAAISYKRSVEPASGGKSVVLDITFRKNLTTDAGIAQIGRNVSLSSFPGAAPEVRVDALTLTHASVEAAAEAVRRLPPEEISQLAAIGPAELERVDEQIEEMRATGQVRDNMNTGEMLTAGALLAWVAQSPPRPDQIEANLSPGQFYDVDIEWGDGHDPDDFGDDYR